MNLNELAKSITEAEGGKVNLTVAQVKEVMKLISKAMYDSPDVTINMLKAGKPK